MSDPRAGRWILLAVAALLAAAVSARAALLASDATGAWHRSVNEEQRRGAMLLEQVRYTYGPEGEMASMIVTSRVLAEELRVAAQDAEPAVAERLLSQALIRQQVADLLAPSSERPRTLATRSLMAASTWVCAWPTRARRSTTRSTSTRWTP